MLQKFTVVTRDQVEVVLDVTHSEIFDSGALMLRGEGFVKVYAPGYWHTSQAEVQGGEE